MTQTNQSRPDNGRLQCDSFPASRTPSYSLDVLRLQHLIARYGVTFEAASIIATLALGGVFNA